MAVDVKCWRSRLPTVEEARPARCPVCGAASRPAGKALAIHGHGLHERQLRGPPAPGVDPERLPLQCRRYQCQPCGAILSVGPGGVLPRKHFAATAIAFALALFGVDRRPAAKVREAVSDCRIVGAAAWPTWATLRRWASAIRSGALWPSLPRAEAGASLRRVAERAAMALSALAPPTRAGAPLSHLAFHGGGHMA